MLVANIPTRFVHFISIVFVSIVSCYLPYLALDDDDVVSMAPAGINSAEERHVSNVSILNVIVLVTFYVTF